MAFEDKKDNSPINSCKGYNSALFFPSEFEADSDSEAFIPINKESDSNLNTLTNSPATFNIHKSNILKNNTVNNLKDNRRFSTPLIGNQVFQNFNQNQNSKKKPILPIIEKIEKKDKYKKRSSYTEGINQNIANTLYNFNKIYNNQMHQIYYPSNQTRSIPISVGVPIPIPIPVPVPIQMQMPIQNQTPMHLQREITMNTMIINEIMKNKNKEKEEQLNNYNINVDKSKKNYKKENKKNGDQSFREGDWFCPNCENLNFSFRVLCNKCKNYKNDDK